MASTPTRSELAAIIANVKRGIAARADSLSLAKLQKATRNDPGVQGPIWVSRVQAHRSAERSAALFRLVSETFHTLDPDATGQELIEPRSVDLELQWTGRRQGIGRGEPEPASMTEAEKYERLTGETNRELTILYVHGGSF